MEIILDLKASITRDILDSLFVIENKEAFDRAMLAIAPYSPDKNMEKYFQALVKNKKIDRKKLKFYFHYFYSDNGDLLSINEGFSMCDCLNIHDMKDISFSNTEEYLNKLRNRDENQILKDIVSFLVYRKDKQKVDILKKYKDIYKDKNKILDLLKECNIPAEAKWSIYLIISEPEKYMKEVCEFIESFVPFFNSTFTKFSYLRDKFNKYISDKMENEGIEYLKKLPSFEEIKKYKTIIVSPVVVSYASIVADDVEDTLFVYIGMNIEKVLEVLKGKSDEEMLLSLLKTISDSSRFNILKMLLSGEMFGLELAEKLNLTNATISHHINLLMVANLIIFTRRDGKIYYKLNKETLRNMVTLMTKEFNLTYAK